MVIKTKMDFILENMEKKRQIGDWQARGWQAITTLYAVFSELSRDDYKTLESVDHRLVDLIRLMMGDNVKDLKSEVGEEDLADN